MQEIRRRLPTSYTGKVTSSSDRRLALVISATNSDPNLCKTIFSATALGYPSPVLINWANEDHSHLIKITGVVEYLEAVTAEDANKGDRLSDDDLILMVDGWDVWFQLPPDVLLQRYHEQLRQANARLRQQWPGPAESMAMEQTIIFSAQKRCWPLASEGFHLHCDELPESVLPADVYGPDTDFQDLDINPGHTHNIRPRFLNSGSVIGPVGDLRRFYKRAKEMMDKKFAEGVQRRSDQGMSAEVLGEQEVLRQWRRERALSDILSDDVKGHHDDGSSIASLYEYHLGLDYAQNLFIPTVFEEQDGDIITLSNDSLIQSRSQALGISPPRLNGVPADMKDASNPLQKLTAQAQTPLDWADLPLYADFYTTAVPVMLHHNAHKDNLKSRRERWWDRTWYFPHLRELLAHHLEPAPLQPLAVVRVEEAAGRRQAREVTYWAPRSDAEKRKPRRFDLGDLRGQGIGELEVEEVCKYADETAKSEKHWYDEVFRDGQGTLRI